MESRGKFDGMPKRREHHGDPGMPNFTFTKPEKETMRKNLMALGKTQAEADAEIAKQEEIITNKQARAKFNNEQGQAA